MIRAPTIAPLPPERVQAYRSLRIALCAELPLHRRRPDEVQEPGEVLAQIGAEDRLAAVFVALDADGLPRGFASLEGRPGTRWGGALELDFGVAPTARRQGIGRALLAAAAAWAAERGAWRLDLTLHAENRPALALAEACGFLREGVMQGSFRGDDGRLADEVLLGLVLADSPPGHPVPEYPPPSRPDAAAVVIRPARPEDWAAYDHYDGLQREETPFLARTRDEARMTPQQFALRFCGARAFVRLAVDGALPAARGVVGSIGGHPGSFRRTRHDVGFGLGVLRSHWGAGIGRRLIGALEEWALGTGARRLSLGVMAINPRAKALYERLGYRQEAVGRHYFRIDGRHTDDIVMAKLLRP